MNLLAFCEGSSDFRTLAGLVDRVFGDLGPTWVREAIIDIPDGVRSWEPFFDVHDARAYVAKHALRVQHGHFSGEAGRNGAAMTRTHLAIVRHLQANGLQLDAMVQVTDLDRTDPVDRRIGLDQARREASWASFAMVFGSPDPEREAWVLIGFEPETAEERETLTQMTEALSFSPLHEPHRLNDPQMGALRDIKRVLRVLTGGDPDREARCWTHSPHERLRADPELAAFLDEVRDRILPRFGTR